VTRCLLTVPTLLAPSLALASGGAARAEGIPWASLAWQGFNLALLLGLLVWFARRPVSDALRNRSTGIRRAIESAQAEREQARAQLEELESKLSDFELHVERLRKELAEQAQREREALLERAAREAAIVQASAERAIREETRRARRELQERSVVLAVELARQVLAARAGDAEQEALARQLLDAVAPQAPEADHGA